jgi:hypothetical protein
LALSPPGATLDGIVGSSVTAAFAKQVPAAYLLLGSALLLEAAVFRVRRLSRLSEALQRTPGAVRQDAPIGGAILSGLAHALKSPYLINVSLFLLLFAVTSTFLYFQQAEIAKKIFRRPRRAHGIFRQRRSLGQRADARRATVCHRADDQMDGRRADVGDPAVPEYRRFRDAGMDANHRRLGDDSSNPPRQQFRFRPAGP